MGYQDQLRPLPKDGLVNLKTLDLWSCMFWATEAESIISPANPVLMGCGKLLR